MKRVKFACLLAIVLTTLLTAGVVGAAQPPSSKWSIVSSSNVGQGDNQLNGVAAISANNIWAVGNYSTSTSAGQTLIEHWNGMNWQVISSPNIGSGDNRLLSIAAISASNIWAVGYYINSTGPEQTLIEHQN